MVDFIAEDQGSVLCTEAR